MKLLSISRVTYKGAALFAGNSTGDYQIDRATAFGASGTISKEDAFELGNSGVVDFIDDLNDYSMTIDANEYGSAKTLLVLAGKDPTEDSDVDFSKDFEYANVDIFNYISGPNGNLYTQVLRKSFLTGYSGNYSVDGNSTESFTLASDNKSWFLNDYIFVGSTPLALTDNAWEVEVNDATKVKPIAVYVNGVETDFGDATIGNKISITISPNPAPEAEVVCRFVADSKDALGVAKFVPNTVSPGAKRRGYVELFLVTGHTPTQGSGKITTGAGVSTIKQFRIQSVSIDATLDRENLAQLGSTYFYDRPLNLPINVNCSFDLTFADLEMFAKFTGKDISTANELRPEDFLTNIGMIVKVYDKRDIDDVQAVEKEIHVPYLVPTDEAFNISLDGNATQTFSFRSHELYVKQA